MHTFSQIYCPNSFSILDISLFKIWNKPSRFLLDTKKKILKYLDSFLKKGFVGKIS